MVAWRDTLVVIEEVAVHDSHEDRGMVSLLLLLGLHCLLSLCWLHLGILLSCLLLSRLLRLRL
jgi:hypothetical protein